MLLDSPTGTGKTAMVLGGVLGAMAEGEKMCVITRTHSQYEMFIQEFSSVKSRHSDLKFGMLVGRRRVCPMDVDHEKCGFFRENSLSQIKNNVGFYSESDISRYRKTVSSKSKAAVCPYFINCFNKGQSSFNVESMRQVNDQSNTPKSPEEFRKSCVKVQYPKCPYELMKSTLRTCDVMVLHYNYLIHPGIREAVVSNNWFGCGFGKIHLVVDESHNLASHIRDASALEFSRKDVLAAVDLITEGKLDGVDYSLKSLKEHIDEAILLLEDINIFLMTLFEGKPKSELLKGHIEEVIPKWHMFKPDPESLRHLNKAADLVKTQFDKKRKNLEIPDDMPTPSICNISQTLTQIAAQKGDRFINTIQISSLARTSGEKLDGKMLEEDYNISLKIIDIDPRDAVKYFSDTFKSLTLISGTLTPTNHYRKLLFYEDINVTEASIPSPFPRENRLILCCKDVTSQAKKRDNALNISNTKGCIQALFKVDGNIAFFFTGYAEKKRYSEYCNLLCEKSGKKIMNQEMGVSKGKFIREYKKHKNSALIGVCRGSFSEGVDYSGETMNAVAVIGLPLDPYNQKQRKINQYYEKIYGKKTGSEIAYNLPALNRALQALGRCIRSSEEKGVLILADTRYCGQTSIDVKKLLPRWIQEEMQVTDSRKAGSLIKQRMNEWGPLSKQNKKEKPAFKDNLKTKSVRGPLKRKDFPLDEFNTAKEAEDYALKHGGRSYGKKHINNKPFWCLMLPGKKPEDK